MLEMPTSSAPGAAPGAKQIDPPPPPVTCPLWLSDLCVRAWARCSLRATVMYDIADSEDDGASEEVGDSAETKEQATANGAGPAP